VDQVPNLIGDEPQVRTSKTPIMLFKRLSLFSFFSFSILPLVTPTLKYFVLDFASSIHNKQLRWLHCPFLPFEG
jgi:hypothetical protein